jgi:hypothetical protein
LEEDVTSISGLKNKPSKKETSMNQAAGRARLIFTGLHGIALLATCFMPVSCLAYSLLQKMEETYSSRILADFQRTTQHYIPEDRTLHNHCCENLKSYVEDWCWKPKNVTNKVKAF